MEEAEVHETVMDIGVFAWLTELIPAWHGIFCWSGNSLKEVGGDFIIGEDSPCRMTVTDKTVRLEKLKNGVATASRTWDRVKKMPVRRARSLTSASGREKREFTHGSESDAF